MDAKIKSTGPAFGHLSPAEFEEFTYDLLSHLGFVNLNWRKGSGKPGASADQGRDIKADLHREDFDKTQHFEKHFVQCKHYTEGVPPNKLEDALAWASAERPSVLLFVVSNFLSNSTKNWLEAYERNNRPAFRIKVWERKDLEGLLASKPALKKKYGLGLVDPNVGLHPAHLRYVRQPYLNRIEQMLAILDSIEPKRRDAIFSVSYHAIVNPKFNQPVTGKEKFKDLLVDRVDYPAFRTKCVELAKHVGEHFLVRAVISDALAWTAHLANPLDVERRVTVHQDLIRQFEGDLLKATNPEEKSEIQHLLEITKDQARTVWDRQKESEAHYKFICESILPRLHLESLNSRSLLANDD
jgi:hypothetical protein